MDNATRRPTVKSLAEFPHADVGAIASLLPDTPWTTTAVQACERHIARAWVDATDTPQAVAVLVPGAPGDGPVPTAYLFGSDLAGDALVEWVRAQEGPLDVVCDDDIGLQIYADRPQAQVVDMAARWFERLDLIDRSECDGLRRLRLPDEPDIAALGVPDLLRSFETLKDLLMVGGASGVTQAGRLVSAAFTVDLSVNYARITAFTVEEFRGQGLATAACRHLIASHHDQGRLACSIVAEGNSEGHALARALGFESEARVRLYRLR